MKRLTCELCGGTNLIKQDGLFVCQSCGTKYSLEEAKKMMVEYEGPADVEKETVTVSNSSRVSNLLQLAQRAKKTNDSKTAAKYYGELLLEDPNNWEAAFYSIFYDAHEIKIAQIGEAAYRVRNCLPNVVNLIQQHLTPEEQKAAFTEVFTQTSTFATMLFQNATNSIKGMSSYSLANNSNYLNNKSGPDLLNAFSKQLKAKGEIGRKGSEWYAPILRLLLDLAILMDDVGVLDKSVVYKLFDVAKSALDASVTILTLESHYFDSGKTGIPTVEYKEYNKVGFEVSAKCEEKRKEREEDRIKKKQAYWEEHAEEKLQLESRKTAITEEIQRIEKAIKEKTEEETKLKKHIEGFKSPLEGKHQTIKRTISRLEAEHSSLGLFKGKEKRRIEEEIATLRSQLPRDKEIQEERERLLSEPRSALPPITEEIKALQGKADALRHELAEIDNELNKEIE